MRKKYVRESLNERWVSSDTGIERYLPDYGVEHKQIEEAPNLVPPKNIKFSTEDFDNYINELIEIVLPQSPMLALSIFSQVMNEHSYLSKRPIGFKSTNEYEKSINKFLRAFKIFKK